MAPLIQRDKRRSKNIEDRRGWGSGYTPWGDGVDKKPLPEATPSKRVSDSMEVGAMRARQSQEMRDWIKGRSRITSATYHEVIKNKMTKAAKSRNK